MLDVRCSAANRATGHHLRDAEQSTPPPSFDVGRSMLNVRCSAAKRAPGHHLKDAEQSTPPPSFDVGRSMLNVRCSAAKCATGHHLKDAEQSTPPPSFDVGRSMLNVRCSAAKCASGHHLNHVSRSTPPPSVRCSAARSVAARSQFPTRAILATQILIGFRDVRDLHVLAVEQDFPAGPQGHGAEVDGIGDRGGVEEVAG